METLLIYFVKGKRSHSVCLITQTVKKQGFWLLWVLKILFEFFLRFVKKTPGNHKRVKLTAPPPPPAGIVLAETSLIDMSYFYNNMGFLSIRKQHYHISWLNQTYNLSKIRFFCWKIQIQRSTFWAILVSHYQEVI